MKVDYNALAASYSAMSDEDFDVVKREDLTLPARVCYDQEKSRRHPGWHYKPPEANAQYAEFLDEHHKMKRRFKINRNLLILFYVIYFILLTQIPNEYTSLRIYLQSVGSLLFLASFFRLQTPPVGPAMPFYGFADSTAVSRSPSSARWSAPACL